MAHLIGVGSALVDLLAHVPETFLAQIPGGKGGTELVDFPTMQSFLGRLSAVPVQVPGGSAANTMVGAAHLGLPCGMLAKVGADDDGRFYQETIAKAGVDVRHLKIDSDLPTGKCLSLITPDSQRTMRTFLGASAQLSPAEITPEDFAGYTHVHLEGYLLFNRHLMVHLLTTARSAGCQISLDLSAPEVVRSSLDVLPDLLRKYVDIVFANEDEASAFCGGQGELAGLEALSQCCAVSAVKLGVRGALIRHGQETATINAYAVNAVDTTGAGDLWAAGFLSAWLRGASLAVAGDVGARVAATVVQVTGAVIPDLAWHGLRRDLEI